MNTFLVYFYFYEEGESYVILQPSDKTVPIVLRILNRVFVDF